MRRGRIGRPHCLGLVLAGCLFAALVAGSAGASDPTFTPAAGSPVATGSYPTSLAFGDLNGDGKRDMAVTRYFSNVSILLGDGAGGFGVPKPVLAGSNPNRVVVAELNGDGKADLAVTNFGSGTVSILLGDGTGGVLNDTGPPIAVGNHPYRLAAADLNGDGHTDLVVANGSENGPHKVSLLLGDGTGSFSLAAGSPVASGNGYYLFSFAVADLNADGKRDLAVANNGLDNVSILLGDGTGGFSAASGSPVAVGSYPSSVVAAELNGDGKPDLAVANFTSTDISILLGDGSGGFSTAAGSPVAAGGNPAQLAAADLNGDGRTDLAYLNTPQVFNTPSTVSMLLGDGAGGFGTVETVGPTGNSPSFVAATDLNGDHKPDLAVANYDSSNATILLNTTQLPTAVALRGFAALRTPHGVELRWRTAQEASLLGFDVYRSGVKLNRTLIAARGGAGGAVHRLFDPGARVRAASTYRLQAVRLDGTRIWIGKATAKR
ncbi:MAG: FG-GAP-like repeat-containing protein [Gaiellaceae bacterium]